MGEGAAVDNRYTRGIARLVAGLRSEDLPPEVRHRAEAHFGSDEEIRDEFRLLATKALPAAQVDRLAEAVMHLEDVPTAAEVARLLVPQR